MKSAVFRSAAIRIDSFRAIERVEIEYLASVRRSNDSLLPERSDYLPDDDDDDSAALKIENCEKKEGSSSRRGRARERGRERRGGSASRQRAMMNGRTGSKAASEGRERMLQEEECLQSPF